MHPIEVFKYILLGFTISVFTVSGFLAFYFSPERSFDLYAEKSLGQFVYDDSHLFNARDAYYNLDNITIDDEFIANFQEAKTGTPVRLTIPKINVDTIVERMGVTEDGAMQVPKVPRNAGWFKFGPIPGEKGTAVITGHYGWRNKIPAVFDDLNKLKPGDKIYTEDDKGNTISFIVKYSHIYNSGDNPINVFSSSDDGTHLNLITCRGEWDKAKKDYSQRLVVFADIALK